MNDDFEKMDSAWMDLTKKAREIQVPSEILKDFSGQVQKKILERRARAAFFMGVEAGALVIALVLGAIALMHFRPVTQQTAPAPEPASAQLKELEESDIVSEIEALKELGVWTDEDETAIGIPADTALGDLEYGLESDPAITFSPAGQL